MDENKKPEIEVRPMGEKANYKLYEVISTDGCRFFVEDDRQCFAVPEGRASNHTPEDFRFKIVKADEDPKDAK